MRHVFVGAGLVVLGGLALSPFVRADEPSEWRGPLVEFTKPDFADWTDAANQDRITDRIWLTRADDQGLFNIRQEPSYYGYESGPEPPAGTEWAYGNAADWESLRFTSWYDWHGGNPGGGPPSTVGLDAVLHLVEADVYIDIRFTSWTQGRGEGGAAGGFAYERATEGVPGEKVWTGPTTTFTKADGADWGQAANQDRIVDGVWITRQDTEGLYNIAREVSYRDYDESSPPTGTEWAIGSVADIDALAFGAWRDVTSGNPPSMVDRDAIVHLIDDDVYVPIRFTSWTSGGNGGGFAYERATEGVPGERVWSGPTTTFTKADYADFSDPANQDAITSSVILTRRDSEGLFNAAVEPGYRLQDSPPEGTEWAYGSAADHENLLFSSWYDWHGGNRGGGPESTVDRDAVVHLLERDVYIDIRFTSWTSGSNGGGFSYMRATEGVPGEQVWTGPMTTFTKADYADFGMAANQDRIVDGVWLTRQDEAGLYNIAREVSYDGDGSSAPAGTEWAFGQPEDIASLAFGSWRSLTRGNPPALVGRDAIVHLIDDGVFVPIRFTSWTESAGGGGFAYERATEGVPGEMVWTGPTVTFTKDDYEDPPSADAITANVALTRGDQQGLYNAAREASYSSGVYAPSPPTGTEWAYGSAADWQMLTFRSWQDWHGGSNGGGPPGTVDRPAVVHLLDADVYVDIMFTSWTSDSDGGGFSYERATEGVAGEKVWTGPTITFGKADYADWGLPANQDRISDGVWLTRQDRRGLFNMREEVGYVREEVFGPILDVQLLEAPGPGEEERRSPPTGTEWALGSLDERALLAFGRWEDCHSSQAPTMVGKQAILHLIEENVYLGIRFTSWTQGTNGGGTGGGGFSYVRTSPLLTSAARVKGVLNFKKSLRDKVVVKGEVGLPADFEPEGKELRVDVGGVDALFVLDRRGKAKSKTSKVVFKYRKRTDTWSYVALIKKGDFAATLEDDGIVNDTLKKQPVDLTVTVSVDGLAFASTASYLYTGKAGKFGKFK